MANWLQDYIEMTEYIPSELREQLTSIRELDLQVHNAMDELERDIKQFFSRIDTLSQQERQEQYEAFLKKCDVATQAASDKVKVADKLHDLVEKSMRLLDQGLEKLKEDLLEGDKAYIVEDLERRSQELDEQLRLEHENMLQRQRKSHELKTNSKGRNINNRFNESNSNPHINKNDNDISQNDRHHSQHNHRHSIPAHNQTHNPYSTNTNHRSRNNSTGNPGPNDVRQKKRERKRVNSTMTIFNRNSRSEDGDSTNQSFITSPLTPDNLVSMQNSDRIMNNVNMGPNNSSLTVLMAGNKNSIGGVGSQKRGVGAHDRLNGNDSIAKQPILTAIDAAHAVSPNATNSDKLVLFSSNPNGDINYNLTHNIRSGGAIGEKQNLQYHLSNPLAGSTNQNPLNRNQLGSHFLSSVGYNSGDNTFGNELSVNAKSDRHEHNSNYQRPGAGPFSNLPLSSRHDPIIMAASQAINATQNMTPGRRTSSLKASYAAVNSGRLPPTTNQQLFDQQGMVHTIYCKCRRIIEGSSMIACDNKDCKIEWFHYECVGITTPPEGNWYCEECRAGSLNFQKNHKQPKVEGVQLSTELI